MTPEDFLKKWVEPAARGLKVLPENLRMKDDLEAVIRAYQDVIDKQAEDLRCFENQGHIDNFGEEMIRKSDDWSPFVSRKKGAELCKWPHGTSSPEVLDIEPRLIPDAHDDIKDCCYPDIPYPFPIIDYRDTIDVVRKSEIPGVLRQDDHIEASPFCLPSFAKYKNDFGIKRPDKLTILGTKGESPASININMPGHLTEEEYQEALKNRERKASEERMREFDDEFLRPAGNMPRGL